MSLQNSGGKGGEESNGCMGLVPDSGESGNPAISKNPFYILPVLRTGKVETRKKYLSAGLCRTLRPLKGQVKTGAWVVGGKSFRINQNVMDARVGKQE